MLQLLLDTSEPSCSASGNVLVDVMQAEPVSLETLLLCCRLAHCLEQMEERQ